LLNAEGEKLRDVRPGSAAANLEYSHAIDSLWADARAYVRGDYRWLSRANQRTDPTVRGFDPAFENFPDQAYGQLNLRLGVTRGGLDISAFVNNAFNADPRTYYRDSSPRSPLFWAQALQPLTAGITGWYRF
jgi:hypothetical protein